MPSIALSAGETSGDIHAANLLTALRQSGGSWRAWGVGGSRLRAAGAEIVFPSEQLSGMGLVEALRTVPALLRARRALLEGFRRRPPDLFVPVDFGGFNLRVAARARALGIPVIYYVPPKVWAWGSWRASRLAASVEEALVILPFEEEFLRRRGVAAHYVGSPVVDHLLPRRFQPEPDCVGLLPGSRRGEVARILPLLAAVAQELEGAAPLRFLVAAAPGLPRDLLASPLAGVGRVEFVQDDAQQVMERSRLVLAASGTATLECALVGTPMVVVYRVNALTYALGRLLVKAPFIALPNLIAGREVVPEFIQSGPGPVAAAARELLTDGPRRQRMLTDLGAVAAAVGEPGASRRAAARLVTFLEGAS